MSRHRRPAAQDTPFEMWTLVVILAALAVLIPTAVIFGLANTLGWVPAILIPAASAAVVLAPRYIHRPRHAAE
ncbi:hypothetical protein [Corynebacterium sp. TAE3-ERU16]|uniref:hypothetical protein n=1 Tax=Corynebacterium sp. TAE3-ERU16 TaxID=2849493 RepID=UPI001C478932|nr:hypothetical protein [Corynebacterium sp. TAE3-ERU16]MBV7292335.1 hypothetical protein [Corynebacterium sp. TAE3-ERU16]